MWRWRRHEQDKRQSTFAEATVDEERKKTKIDHERSPPGRGKGWVSYFKLTQPAAQKRTWIDWW